MSDLPDQMRPLPTDIVFPGSKPIGNCLCSRCCEPIADRIAPIWMWTSDREWAWRYHPSCVGIEEIEYEDDNDGDWYDDWRIQNAFDKEDRNNLTEEEIEELVIEVVEEEEEQLDLGACCACDGEKNVRNIISLHQRAPVEGSGWGCVVCGLPPDGATAIVCDRCLESGADILEVINGYPADKQRLALADLTYIPFEHNMNKHTV